MADKQQPTHKAKKKFNKKKRQVKKQTGIQNTALRDALLNSDSPSVKFAIDCIHAKNRMNGTNPKSTGKKNNNVKTSEAGKTVRSIMKGM